MSQVKIGSKVIINFVGRLEDGTIFDSTLGNIDADEENCPDEEHGVEIGPVELVVGQNEFFPKIEEALIGMKVGESTTVAIPAEEAFGTYDDGNVFTIGLDQIPDDFIPSVGQDLELTAEDSDESEIVTVLAVTDTEITFDANHPFSGQDLIYDIELVKIVA